MFMYALALSFSLFSLCHAMTDESTFAESQNIWTCEKPAFIENCSKGAQYLTRQQLAKITKAWDRFIEIASKNNVPIIPFVFSFRKPTGILKLFKSKPCLILSVLPPVYPKQNLAFNERYLDLKENVYKKMSEKI